jgi:two-component system, OmpR family, alkaline phosphatase synthesis response regulator PhoP
MANIFIADDDPLVIDLLSFKLKRAGHNVVHSSDGETAILQLSSEPTDLLILDSLMPDVDGIEFIRQMKANLITRDIPIIVLSGQWQEQDMLEAFAAGAEDYVTRPFSPAELLARIEKALARQADNKNDDGLF